ncbi:MAG: ATP-binding cassette domain-containing protein, partial [Burkholderiaceae bacterium]
MTPRLQVDKLVVRFAGLLAVNDVSLILAPGEIRGLIGPNGAGKTTVINAITGTVAAAAGRIALDGQDISNRPPHQISRLGLGRTFQHVEPFFDMSLLDNVLVGVARHIPLGMAAAALATPGALRAESAAREAAHAILE